LPEFFSMGRPVILPETNVGRFIEHGRHGLVAPKVDASAIVQSIQVLHADPDARERLADGALEFAEQHFNWEKNARQLDEFYRAVMTERKQARRR
jgi:glycosyltransferase involved in cell wall biosynthesis